MTNKNQPASDSAIWQLTANVAQLGTPRFGGRVDLRDPLRGLHELTYNGTAVEGSVLGVAIDSVGEDARVEEAFVRGDDLVASYREANGRSFSLQVYWKVRQHESDVVVIDTLLSLETPLLESFPRILINSELPDAKVWQPDEDRDYLLMRIAGKNWSYAEMAHPDDSGDWRMRQKGSVQRTLGGTFLEKGVIRRLRLRGAFLPRENDLPLAAKCFAEFATAAPPLTS